ncbi:MAG: chromosome segregation protein SMC [Eubacteriales bacterium]|nr:chromosome segregation protein SMC [Eubacteriales bacterium]
MYLKNIEVQGFKSFAQKLNFEFHNGITGIVGPNGSGKSNVSDAVRWVLGEQSAKQLRGGNMQDVIFSGTETRKPLSFASVAITLDNSDHVLPIDYKEVTVTRRLYRSGESEYLMNGTNCRLRDINELFYDTGIGKEGYSIIGQGQIDKILSGKPDDRRDLFDEAAGIVKFKRRKATTLKKLEEEKNNLTRVTDILAELTKQLGPLERQSEKARIYLAKRDTLRELDVNMFLLDHERTIKLLEELAEKTKIAQDELTQKQSAFDETKETYERLELELDELNQKLDLRREEVQDDALQKKQMEGQVEILKEQISSISQNEELYRNRRVTIEDEIQGRTANIQSLEEERSELRKLLKDLRQKLKVEEDKLETVRAEIDECTRAVEDGKNEIIEILNSRANTKGKVQRFDTMMEQIDIRKAEISQKILRLKSDEEKVTNTLSEEQTKYDRLTEQIQSIEEKCRGMEKSIQDLQSKLKKQNEQLEAKQVMYHRETSRLESLKNITERYDGYGNSIRRVMEQKAKVPGIKGVVADLIQVQKNYEVAIETALGGSIQNIVTDNEQTAKQMIEFLKKNRFGRATFLPLSSIQTKGGFTQKDALKEPGVIGLASELVDTEPLYRDLFVNLLGRVLVIDHIDHALAIARKYRHSLRMVTVEGELLNPGGSMTGGAFKNNSNLLGRRREMEELETKIASLKKELEELRTLVSTNRDRRNHLRETLEEFKEKLRQLAVDQNTARLGVRQQEARIKEIQHSYDRVRVEQSEIRTQVEDVKADHQKIEDELKASQNDEKELETFIETRQAELEELEIREDEALQALEEMRLEEQSLSQKEAFANENLTRIQTEIENLISEKEEIDAILENGSDEVREKNDEVEKLLLTIDDFSARETKGRSEISEWQKQKDEKNSLQKTLFEKRDDLSAQINLLDKECYRLRTQIEKLEEKQESSISYMWEEYEITPNNAKQYRKEEYNDRQALKNQIGEIKDEIRKLGAVNVNAIEEYKEVQERHSFLSEQYNDLKEAEETLMGIIQELDDGMRKQFTEKFREIQREFDKAFKELFGGGKGSLELDEEMDILEAGIRIISQPPGKKLQNMMQLSGGEKALTAIALLFAIQNLKPSPFCLLDEIEAALDDSNVGRFAGYLQKLTKNTQFIVITHRRGTMNAADRLYGITMQEKGVSTLVSVDLVENQLSQ